MPTPQAPPRNSLRLEMRCELAQVRLIAQAARAFLAQQGCVEEDIMDCELALVEACNNAAQYALPSARGLPVLVDLLTDSDTIEMRVTDHTCGFDWPARPQLPIAESERGRGVFLIASVIDEAQYVRGLQQNTLFMRRNRTGPASA